MRWVGIKSKISIRKKERRQNGRKNSGAIGSEKKERLQNGRKIFGATYIKTDRMKIRSELERTENMAWEFLIEMIRTFEHLH